MPWEIGLAETQQTLLLNDLRSRIVVQTDGQLKTGRDVVIAAMLGADEMGFSTAPLIATGCIMMRACHLNTCPVGIATQDPELRKRFQGTPEHVVNFFFFVAEEVREIMASLGVRTLDELIGRVDLLAADEAIDHWKARGVDLTHMLHVTPSCPRATPPPPRRSRRRPCSRTRSTGSSSSTRGRCARAAATPRDARAADPQRQPLRRRHALEPHRPRATAPRACPRTRSWSTSRARPGQSFGGWLAPGRDLHAARRRQRLHRQGALGRRARGAARPTGCARSRAEENVIVGNTVLYGATGGRAFFRGLAGERFAVRNSGAVAVVEGVGDHGCEYMTGGRVVVLGPHRAQLRGGHERRRRLRARRGRRASRARCNMGAVGFDALARRRDRAARADRGARARAPARRSPRACSDEWEELLARAS